MVFIFLDFVPYNLTVYSYWLLLVSWETPPFSGERFRLIKSILSCRWFIPSNIGSLDWKFDKRWLVKGFWTKGINTEHVLRLARSPRGTWQMHVEWINCPMGQTHVSHVHQLKGLIPSLKGFGPIPIDMFATYSCAAFMAQVKSTDSKPMFSLYPSYWVEAQLGSSTAYLNLAIGYRL